MEEKIETYDVPVFCENCREKSRLIIPIPKGVLVKDFECPVCGCKALQPTNDYISRSRW